jgi:hypothetical protein
MKLYSTLPTFCSLIVLFFSTSCTVDQQKSSKTTLISIRPQHGVPGTEVIILGKNFPTSVDDASIFFNGIKAPILSVNDSVIITKVPAFASTGEVVLETMRGDDVSTANGGAFNIPSAGGIDLSFNKEGAGPSMPPQMIKVLKDGTILVSGAFRQYNGEQNVFMAKLNEDGGLESNFKKQMATEGLYISNFDVTADGNIVIAGDFKVQGDDAKTMLSDVSRLLPTGEYDATMLTGYGPVDGPILAVDVQSDGKILAGGRFTEYRFAPPDAEGFSFSNTISRNNIIRLNADFSLDESFNPGSGFNGDVTNIVTLNNGDIMVSGMFDSYNGMPAHGMVLLHNDGRVNASFSVARGFTGGHVNHLLALPDGKFIAAGTFTGFRGANVPGIVRIAASGSHDKQFTLPLKPKPYSATEISCLALDKRGNLALGGLFDFDDGIRTNLVIVDSTANLLPFDAGITFENAGAGPPIALAFDTKNRLLVSSYKYYEANGKVQQFLVRMLTE